jgi:hypothetical protein
VKGLYFKGFSIGKDFDRTVMDDEDTAIVFLSGYDFSPWELFIMSPWLEQIIKKI